MAVHLQIRDLPSDLHQTLRHRAKVRGLSLRQYAMEVLRDHCQQPTLEDWLDGLRRLPSVSLPGSAAEAVQQAREEEEADLANALHRP